LARFLADVEAPRGQLDQRSVVVLDEAGMVDTRRLARVLAAAERGGAKVVLVGDHRQLPEIEAGGAFGSLVRRLGAIELTENRRQREPWEREALDDLRDGDVVEALAALSAEGRVVVAESGEDVRQNLVADWWVATSAGEQAVMVAARHRDVADLNARARQRRMAASQLGGPELVVDERAFAGGEQVVCLRNDRRLGVVNGTLATVVEVRSDDRSLVVETNDAARRELPAWYLEGGHLDHAYALTIHKAQGMTVDRSFVLGSDRLYREAGYVGLSRGRHSNHLYVAGPDEDKAGHQPADESELDVERVAAWLGRSAAKRLATDEGRLEELQQQRERLGELWRERDELGRQIALAAREATDRPEAIQRTVGTEQVPGQRASVGHRQRTKRPGWRRASSVVSRVWGGPPLGDGVVAELPPDRSGEALEAQRQRVRRASELKEAIRRQAAVVAGGEEADPPDHLLRLIGPVPQPRESKHAQAWREAAAAVASYRARWGAQGLHDALEPAPRHRPNPLS
ncbi:MAG: AAA family ATPase, partial [Actinomycetota bacterium]|nr:AAA family ATPase [Actinomycetota bacterium]